MPRFRKTSVADDLLDLVSRLPWGIGVVLALVIYLVLHHMANQPVAMVIQPGQPMASMVLQSLAASLARIGQYLLPLICLAGAGVSAWRRRQRKALVDMSTHSQAGPALDGMSWREFEMLVGECFRMQGYRVLETGGGGADGGVDLFLSKPGRTGNERFLVQCKQWRAFKVGVNVVRELYGVMAAKGAAGGFVITSGQFTDEAVKFADGRNVRLIDGGSLHDMLLQVKSAGLRESVGPTSAPSSDQRPEAAVLANCPLCDKPMVRRQAKRGSRAGAEFWGCTGYPACRGTRSIS